MRYISVAMLKRTKLSLDDLVSTGVAKRLCGLQHVKGLTTLADTGQLSEFRRFITRREGDRFYKVRDLLIAGKSRNWIIDYNLITPGEFDGDEYAGLRYQPAVNRNLRSETQREIHTSEIDTK